MTQIGQGSVRGLLIGQLELLIGRHLHLWQLCSGSIQHPHPVCRAACLTSSGHPGTGGWGGCWKEAAWGRNGSWSYLHSLPGLLGHDDYECSDQCNIQQHPAAARGPRHTGPCVWLVARNSLGTPRDRNRSRTSCLCRGLGGLAGAT